ncbi:hypothetical protein IH575_03670 [Candidatus Dojkabacteria bacterium]|nr:hypothetical protein [Candidatus Dojkabacteria bacterium]
MTSTNFFLIETIILIVFITFQIIYFRNTRKNIKKFKNTFPEKQKVISLSDLEIMSNSLNQPPQEQEIEQFNEVSSDKLNLN